MIRMSHLVLLLLALLNYSTVSGSPEKVMAYVGEDVILPCSFHITANSDIPTVEWSKEGLSPNVIFLYRDGCETFEMKHSAFEYRTSLIMKELKNGNISLRISNIQLSDDGKYQCLRIWKDASQEVTTVELVVGAVSEPKLSVVSAESRGGVTLQCEANCWLPQPEIKFLDDQGNNLPAEDPKRDQDASGCFTVRQRMSLQTATSRVTCQVHQPQNNHTRETEILIPGSCLSLCFLINIAVVASLILICGFAVCLWKRKFSKSADEQKMPVTRQASDQSTVRASSENLSLRVRSVTAENIANNNHEQLETEVAQLKAKLLECNNTISQLQNQLKSQLSPVVCQHNQPTLVCSASKKSPSDVSKSIGLDASTSTSDISKSVSAGEQKTSSLDFLPQNKGPVPGIQLQNGIPAPELQVHRKPRRNSSPAHFSCQDTVTSSFSSVSKSKKKFNLARSLSESSAQPDPIYTKLLRRRSLENMLTVSSNRYSPLADLKEESDPLVTCEQSKSSSVEFQNF